jgi:hypothetical protein
MLKYVGGELYKLNSSYERRERLKNNSLSSLFDEVNYE